MKQFYMRHLLLCLCLLAGITVNAYDAKIYGIYYNLTDGWAEVTRSDNEEDLYTGSIVIPETITYMNRSYQVIGIDAEAFAGCWNMTSVVIPSTVLYIGELAFYECKGLSSIVIPSSVTEIGDYTFAECYFISENFVNNSSFADYEFGVNIFEEGTVEQSDGILIYDNEIMFCRPWVTSVTIPYGVTSIGNSAFEGCSSLASVSIPNSVTSIGNSAFDGCSSLASVSIPNSVTSIGNSAFNSCNGLTSVTIPNSVKSIGRGAFSGCSGLTSVNIPDGVTKIGPSTFNGCI